jgi:hypothetical protein
MKISERVRNMLRDFLRIEPAHGQSIVIRESMTWETSCIRNNVWYRSDAAEIEQFFKAVDGNGFESTGRFWASAPSGDDVRKAHSGLPAIMANTLAYIVKSDLQEAKIAGEGEAESRWSEISKDSGFSDLVGEAVAGTLVIGDGAFKISIDKEVGQYPILEFWNGDRVEFRRKHGRVYETIFRTPYVTEKGKELLLCEVYRAGSIRYELWDEDKPVELSTVPELKEYKDVSWNGEFSLAVPLMFYKSQKYPGRGRSIFENKTDAFDAHDEVISQWIDAVRAGRVVKYIPEELIPKNPENGRMQGTAAVKSFGSFFVEVESTHRENDSPKIDAVQPEIRYEAFVESYAATLNMCLQGVMSPATLGIDVGKMSSAESQREKKDITGYTRNAITDALEKVLPQVVEAMLMAYDLSCDRAPGTYNAAVGFGEYGAPDFDSRVSTISAASTGGIMSIEAQVDELWGASKDDEWKQQEVARIKRDKGILEAEEPRVGDELP